MQTTTIPSSLQTAKREPMTKVSIPDSFKDREPAKALFYCISNILIVVFSGVVAYHINTWYAYAIAFVLVAARVQALYILQHECMHWLLLNKKKDNDVLGAIISGVIGTKLFEGRIIHFKHHKDLGLDSDPNTYFYDLNNRSTFGQKFSHFFMQLIGLRLIQMIMTILGKKSGGNVADVKTLSKEDARADLKMLVGCQLIILTVITLLSSFWVYLALFFLPIVTLTCLFESIRSFSEHTLPGEVPTCYAEEHRLFLMNSGPFELFFISQFQFHYHHLHHTYPYVVTFKLKELHEWLQANDPDYSSRYILRPGYVRVFIDFLFNKDFSGSGKNYPKIKAA